METATSLSPETAEILESLTFIEKECLTAWQGSAKTTKELGLLREARVCLQLKMKILGIGSPKVAPASAEPTEPEAPPASEPIAAEAPETKEAPARENPGLKALQQQYKPEYFRQLDSFSRQQALKRFGLTEAEATAVGYTF